MRTTPCQVVTNGDMSADIDDDSRPIDVRRVDYASFQAIFSGTSPKGVFKLQASNDSFEEKDYASVSNWTDITGSSVELDGSENTGTILLNIHSIAFLWVRCVYVADELSPGTGTLNVNAVKKGLD